MARVNEGNDILEVVLPEKLLNGGNLWYKYLHGHFARFRK
jgi:hypothetical protein